MKIRSIKIQYKKKVSIHLEKKMKTFNSLIQIDNILKIRNIQIYSNHWTELM
jgi:hypothetical protein